MSLPSETIVRSLASRNFADLQSEVDRFLAMHDWHDSVSFLQSATNQLFHRNWLRASEAILCLLDMPELFGLDIDIFAQMRTLNQVTALKQASSELYPAFLEMAINQLKSGGSTLFFNAKEISKSRSAGLLTALADARHRESLFIIEEIDGILETSKKEWLDASRLWRTGNGYRMLRAAKAGLHISLHDYLSIRELLLRELKIEPESLKQVCKDLRSGGQGKYLLLSDRMIEIIKVAIDSRGVRGKYEAQLQPRIELQGLDEF
ncbi:MAG: hypothetical protein EAX95_09355 [Candidatus Thorarchaeota archaeon]|nr:hypothetical protein [Candidatus Thorarchaeota archaeon]